jgi:hypothetical protein
MGDLTEHFSESEFREKRGIIPRALLPRVPENLRCNIRRVAELLQAVRYVCGKPIIIHAGYRSPVHNAKVGGAANSHHTIGAAVDAHIEGFTPAQFAGLIAKCLEDGTATHCGEIGIYPTHIHVSIRGPLQLFSAKGAVIPIDLIRRVRDLKAKGIKGAIP